MRDKLRDRYESMDIFVTYAGTIMGVFLAITKIFSVLISSNIALMLA